MIAFIPFWGPFGILVYMIALAPFAMVIIYLIAQWLWEVL